MAASEIEGGYVLLYRRVLDNPVFRTPSEAMVFGYLVMKAAWRPVKVRYKDRCITLERGQLAMSVRDLAAAMERSKSWADRFLRRLAERDMIGTADGTGVNVITICNYDNYQVQPWMTGTAADARPGQDRDTTGTQNNKGNKGKERITPYSPPDWVPVEAWQGWLEMRKQIHHPASARAQALAVAELDRLRKAGHDPAKLLDMATMRSYRGIFADEKGGTTLTKARHEALQL